MMRETNVRASFFENGKNTMIEIRIVGSSDTIIRKASAEDTARFAAEYQQYKGNLPKDVGGTPLTEVPGIDQNRAVALSLKGIHNAEDLAELDDGPAKNAIGMGWLDLRKSARNVIELNKMKAEAEKAKAAQEAAEKSAADEAEAKAKAEAEAEKKQANQKQTPKAS
ncbi:hypothetical protein [Thalassospira marina]|uniref:Uncharacterized protein n=1 Tax=Thalassospira marina TaxID=2048283 RepID=A0A2N3KXU9_9PROT|nr:hypothetical protein [Thalassospira marina]PKR55405.1 hypothetical protein COO20_04340 [Thalassospira marina]